MSKKKIIFFLANTLANIFLFAQEYKLTSLKTSAKETGLQVAEKFLTSPHGVYNAPNTKPHIHYFEVCTWSGALCFAHLTSNTKLKKLLDDRFTLLINKDTALLPVPDHVDYKVFGCLPLEMYLQEHKKNYYDLG